VTCRAVTADVILTAGTGCLRHIRQAGAHIADYDRLMPGRITSHGGAQIIRSGARLSLVIGRL
jgi:hypothetical protein